MTYYYKYRILNKNKTQASLFSEMYSITIPQPELSIVPKSLKLDDIIYYQVATAYDYDTEITVSWDVVEGAEIYYVYSHEEGREVEFLGSTTSTTFTHMFEGGRSDVEFIKDIKVKAVKTSTKQGGPFSVPLEVLIK